MKIDSPSILNQLIVTGSVQITGSLLISGSVQATTYEGVVSNNQTGSFLITGSISNDVITLEKADESTFNLTVNNVQNAVSTSYVDFTGIANLPTLVSSSAQVSYNSIQDIPTGIVSSSAQISYTGIVNISAGIVSSSTQVEDLLPAGTVSGSSQISYPDLSNIPVGIVSGTLQVIGILEPLNIFSGSTQTKLSALELTTQSLDQRLDSFETVSSSYARIDVNNTFSGLQTFTDLTVNGTGSFGYIQSVTGSAKVIGDAFILLNENTPASNFAGIKVVDSGSAFTTASFVYDGLNNNWVFQHEGSEDSGSSLAIFGPLSQGGLGTEVGLSQNKVPKAVTNHGHHIGDSNITDTGTLITLGSNTVVEGTLLSTNTTLVSSSAQISYTGITNVPAGIVSGSAQVAINSTTGTLDVNKGGTGQTSYTDGQLLIGNTTGNTLTKATLTAGTGITVTNGAGSISIAAINNGTVTSVGGTGTVAGLTLTGTVTSTGNLTLGGSLSTPVSTINDSTTVGQNLVKLTNPSAIRFIRINANNTVDALSDSDFRTAIGAYASSNPSGYTTNTGTVTSIATGNGITGGTITTTGTLGLTGQALALHNLATNGVIARTGTGTVAGRTITGTTNQVTVTNGDGVSGNPTLSLPQSINTAASVQFGSFGVGTAASGTTGEIRATNEITAYYSDDRLKNKVDKIGNALEKVNQLNGYYFVENDLAKSLGYNNDKVQVGVSAQEVQAVLPEVVTTAPIDDQYLTVKYDKLVPLLIEAIKEQDVVIKQLISDIDSLKNKLNDRGN